MTQTQTLAREVAALQRMTVKQLRQRYAEVFGEETNGHNKAWLVRRLAWRLQANAGGDLNVLSYGPLDLSFTAGGDALLQSKRRIDRHWHRRSRPAPVHLWHAGWYAHGRRRSQRRGPGLDHRHVASAAGVD